MNEEDWEVIVMKVDCGRLSFEPVTYTVGAFPVRLNHCSDSMVGRALICEKTGMMERVIDKELLLNAGSFQFSWPEGDFEQHKIRWMECVLYANSKSLKLYPNIETAHAAKVKRLKALDRLPPTELYAVIQCTKKVLRDT